MKAIFRKFLKRFILVFGGIALALIISVVLDRIAGHFLYRLGYFKALSPGATEIYDTSEFKLTANISSQGIRNEELELPKPKNTYRILALGDSFTYGWGVTLPKTWVKLLQNNLTIPGKKVEVINTGVPAIDLFDKIKICKSYKDRFGVDAIIIGFYPTTDLYGLLFKENTERILQKIIDKSWPTLSDLGTPNIGNFHKFAKKGEKINVSNVWRKIATQLFHEHNEELSRLNPAILKEFAIGKVNPALLEFVTGDPDYWNVFLDQKTFDLSFVLLNQTLKQIRIECIGNLPTILLFIPVSNQVAEEYSSYMEDLGFKMNKDLTKIDWDSPLSQVAKNQGFYYISPLEEFRKTKCLDCYYPYDTHLNVIGHQKVADYLLDRIKNILPR